MKYVLSALLLLAGFTPAFAQKPSVSNPYAALDKRALQIPDSLTKTTIAIARYVAANFKSDSEQTRTVFAWMANHIEYDLANMYAINFYEKSEEKIAKVLSTRRGICDAYAATFAEILNKLGIKSFVVEGYTKQAGFADYIPHAWCAALVGGHWLLYDPTWGSGYVSNGKFVRRVNNAYFAAKGQTLIRSHMPFDYLWQMLSYPVTNQEFYEGKTAGNKARPAFSYADSIQVYEKLSHTAQLDAAARRIEAAGLKNAMVFDRLHHIKQELEYDRQNKSVNLYNGAVADYNEGLQYYNDFINYRNSQFKPAKADADIQAMLDGAASRFADARAKMKAVENPEPANATLILQLTKAMDEADTHLAEMQEWLSKYFSKGKAARKTMFYKVTWFGVPLN